MIKKVLIAFPDYSHTCLRTAKILVQSNYRVEIAVAYNFKLIPNFFRDIKFGAFQKLYRRRSAVNDLLAAAPKDSVTFVNLSLTRLIRSFYKGYFIRKRPFFNILKDMIQEDLCPFLPYRDYSLLYLFDTVGYMFQEEALKYNIPTVLECRGPHFEYSQNLRLKLISEEGKPTFVKYQPENEDQAWWYKKLTTEPNRADFLVCYSEFHRQQYLDYSTKNKDDVFILPLPCTIPKINKINSCNPNSISFYYAGNVTNLKGITFLIAAWSALQNRLPENHKHSLHIYGACSDQKYLAEFNSIYGIEFHGKTLHNELMKKVKNHDVCIFPSLLDSFGFVLQEALQLNIPVISNYTSGASFLFEHELHGFKCKDSYSGQELADCILRFINQPDLINEYSIQISKLPDFNETYMNEVGGKEISRLFTNIK